MAHIVDQIYSTTEKLLGHLLDDLEVENFLKSLGHWPVKPFESEEFSRYLEDKLRGFCLLFKDCTTVVHPLASGKPAHPAIFTGCFFYCEGVDGYTGFKGALPHGITWADTSTSLAKKIGNPENAIYNEKSGKLMSNGWNESGWILTARYAGGGTSLRYLYLGLG